MTKNNAASSTGAIAKKAWRFLSKFPMGNVIFSKFAGYLIPYTGSMKPIVLKLEDGYAQIQLNDRRRVRNHLKSIHAIALANLGEFTTGLSLLPLLDTNAIAILTKLEVVYLKKARGTLIAEARTSAPECKVGDTPHPITADIKNSNGDIVCQVFATWQIRVTNAAH